ncbi:MAG: DNA cytosine methyltransferase [Zetaproteobacteria bacterium]|nr:DNA cytosine methyltransferase [Zetaproteobacteria bacterium]
MKQLLDLFCGAGGAAAGYHLAGFEVTGIDITEQPNYPYKFIHADALEADISGYDAIHASPPCQGYCWSTTKPRAKGKTYPDLIEPVRGILIASGKPYVIENVPTAPLINPTYLEGTMFGLNVIRRRGFETNWWLPQPRFRPRKRPIMQASKQDPDKLLQKSAYCTVAGNGADSWSCRVADWRVAMGISWMTREEIKQAIPPAYTEHIGRHLMGALNLIPSNSRVLKPSIISATQCYQAGSFW